MWSIFRLGIKGLVIGFSIAAPVGPIGVLVIRRTLADGRLKGFVSGLGAATADAIYGSVAGFGLTFISAVLIEYSGWLRLVGAAFLIFLGLQTFFAPAVREDDPAAPETGSGLLRAYASTFALTLTNPLTIISFAGVLAGLGIGDTGGDYGQAALLVSGVFAGSALWWVVLSLGVGIFRRWIGPGALRWINRLSGAFIFVVGVVVLVQFFMRGV